MPTLSQQRERKLSKTLKVRLPTTITVVELGFGPTTTGFFCLHTTTLVVEESGLDHNDCPSYWHNSWSEDNQFMDCSGKFV